MAGVGLSIDTASLRSLATEIAQHCPCGARAESPQTHPHVSGCQVYRLLKLIDLPAQSVSDNYRQSVAPALRKRKIKQPTDWGYWLRTKKPPYPRCPSTHGNGTQCQKFEGHEDGYHQDGNEVWRHP
jgi:hypothetical protein